MLPPAKGDLARRRWIWQVLSELFLDEEMTEDRLRQIARIVAECGYSDAEVDAIYRREVAPAVAFNFFDVAGTWGYFDSVWLEDRILRRCRLGYWFDRLIIAPGPVWVLRHDWRMLKGLVAEQRQRVQEEREELGDQWRPCWAEACPCYRWAAAEEPHGRSDSDAKDESAPDVG